MEHIRSKFLLVCCHSLVIFQVIRPSIAKEPFSFVIFQGGLDLLSPSGSALEKTKDREIQYVPNWQIK